MKWHPTGITSWESIYLAFFCPYIELTNALDDFAHVGCSVNGQIGKDEISFEKCFEKMYVQQQEINYAHILVFQVKLD